MNHFGLITPIKTLAWSVACEDYWSPLDQLLACTLDLITNIYTSSFPMVPGWVSDLHLWILVCQSNLNATMFLKTCCMQCKWGFNMSWNLIPDTVFHT